MPDVLTATVLRATRLSPHVREITLSPTDGPVHFLPGQWLSLRLPVGDRPPLVRAYSLASAPQPDNTLTLCFDRVEGGLGSEFLWNIEPGAIVEFTGPLGNFVLPEANTNLVLASRYTGVVPFRAMLQAIMAESAHRKPKQVHLVYSAPSQAEAIYHRELSDLAARAPWLDYHIFSEPGEEMAFLEARACDWMPFTPLVCGVREFTFPVRAFFMENLAFERRAVKVENFNGPTAR